MLANTVIMRSSILTFIETPPNLLANESSSFISRVPSVWDETIVLPPSKIGEVAVFAVEAARIGLSQFKMQIKEKGRSK